VLTTDQKGTIAETAIIHAAVKLDIEVYKPVNDGTRCDLIFDLGGRLTRVQCKWAARHDDVLIIRCYSCRRTKDGLLTRAYTADEIDAFAAYCVDLDRCYFFPFETMRDRRTLQLRLAPSRNNQNEGINWAEDYEFGATLGASGAVAQLGERERGTLEAAGSSPAGST
jgi:PD-(D/E)XK endonuclease